MPDNLPKRAAAPRVAVQLPHTLSERHDELGTHLEVRGPAAALARLQVQLAETA